METGGLESPNRSKYDVDASTTEASINGLDDDYSNRGKLLDSHSSKKRINGDHSNDHGENSGCYTETVSYTHLTLPTIYSV